MVSPMLDDDYLSLEQLQRQAALYARQKEDPLGEDTDFIANLHEKPEQISSEITGVLFQLEAQWFALDVAQLDEVAEMPNSGSFLPHMPVDVLGLVNLRGEVVLLVDLGAMLGFSPVTEWRETQRVVLIKGEARQSTGFLIPKIQDVVNLDAFERSIKNKSDEESSLIDQVGVLDGRTIARLDVEKMLQNINARLK